MTRPGDGVVVPGELCLPLAKIAVLGAKMLSDHNGGLVLVPGMAALLAELATFASETPGSTVVPVQSCAPRWLSAGEAAGLAGVSVQRVRFLARTGRIQARRAGRDWLIDVNSITRRSVA